MPVQRIDKILSTMTSLSRSEAHDAVKAGRVRADGMIVKKFDEKFDPEVSAITLDGVPVRTGKNVYLMLNKPAGYVTSTEEKGQKTVLDLIGDDFSHFYLFPAGRLDKDTEGFLILTNDGEFCHKVISPKTDTVKCYRLRTADPMSGQDAETLEQGVVLKDGTVCRSARLVISDDPYEADIYITEGKYHEVRRLLASRGNRVTYLKRLSIGGVQLDPVLRSGEYRELKPEEIRAILGQNC